MNKSLVIFTILSCSIAFCNAQSTELNEEAYKKQYESNIKQVRIDGTYIPENVADALSVIKSISPEEGLANFSKIEDENLAAQKIHFGLGRWMIVNWNFYDGSRLSHHLKEMGILHPDDMAKFLLIKLHRELIGNLVDDQPLIDHLAEERKKVAEKLIESKRKL